MKLYNIIYNHEDLIYEYDNSFLWYLHISKEYRFWYNMHLYHRSISPCYKCYRFYAVFTAVCIIKSQLYVVSYVYFLQYDINIEVKVH